MLTPLETKVRFTNTKLIIDFCIKHVLLSFPSVWLSALFLQNCKVIQFLKTVLPIHNDSGKLRWAMTNLNAMTNIHTFQNVTNLSGI